MACGTSGNSGKVLVDTVEVAAIINFNYSVAVQQTKRTTSSTAPWPCRTTGNKDVTGDFTIQLGEDGAIPAALQTALLAGSQITLVLEHATSEQATGPAKFEEGSFAADVDGGEDQQATYTFGADGAWTLPDDS